ncbi:hypothetical protein GCM10023349_02720 [Nocardioides conyzicola]|uniref:Calcium-binding protein n=2 Tax=Nocardioides conyzicola TaxID=1651781 RepID=A0ABP8WL82_9ACTN
MGAMALLALGVSGIAVATTPAQAAGATCQGHAVTIAATGTGRPVTGTDGPDVISSVGFTDVTIDAKGGDDIVCAGRDSVIEGGPGADSFSGVRSTMLAYNVAAAGVQVDLAAGTVVDGGETDTVTGIHAVMGSKYDDTFVGTASRDTYNSGDYYVAASEDVLVDGDHVAMGAGDDSARVRLGSVDLGAGDDDATVAGGTVTGGAGDDELYLVTNGVAKGGPGDDSIYPIVSTVDFGLPPQGSRLVVHGGAGRDVILHPVVNREGDACSAVCAVADLDGGGGRDTLRFVNRGVVDLAAGRSRTEHGRATLRSFEDVLGSSGPDVIRGDARANRLVGGRGNDVLVGRGGRDTAIGGPGQDRCAAEVRRTC